jgi:hypothetical protein
VSRNDTVQSSKAEELLRDHLTLETLVFSESGNATPRELKREPQLARTYQDLMQKRMCLRPFPLKCDTQTVSRSLPFVFSE